MVNQKLGSIFPRAGTAPAFINTPAAAVCFAVTGLALVVCVGAWQCMKYSKKEKKEKRAKELRDIELQNNPRR